MDEQVRPAAPPDIDELLRLESDAWAAAAARRGGEELTRGAGVPSRRRWAEDLADPSVTVLVATIDGVPIGVLRARSDGILRVELIWVEPEARGLGLGDALLAAALDAGRRRGDRAIEAVALPGDRETKNLYERAGIKARAIIVHRPL